MKTDRDSKNTEHILKLIKLPDLFSICSTLLGFTAIILVLTDISEEAIKNALVLILLAAVFDGLDGMAARTIEYSPMGKHLDSLADMISFGAAPAIVAYALLTNYLRVSYIYEDVVLAFCGAYVICGQLRLARFDANASLESAQKEGQQDFVGFPTTWSTIFLASSMLLAVEVHLSPYTSYSILVGLICVLCILMTSRIRYRNIKDMRIVIPLGLVFLTLFLFYIFSLQFVYPAVVIVTLAAIYICSPLVRV